MNHSNRKALLCFLIGALLMGLAVYRIMTPPRTTAEIPGLSFDIPYEVRSQISENSVLCFSDQSTTLSGVSAKKISVNEKCEVMTEEMFQSLAEKDFLAADKKGTFMFPSFSAKYFLTSSEPPCFQAYIYNMKTGDVWTLTFENLDMEVVSSVLSSIKFTRK